MTNERAAKIILDLINAGEAEYRNFSVEEIRALKKAYVALNSEPTTNAERIRSMTDEELLNWINGIPSACMDFDNESRCTLFDTCRECWLEWLKEECDGE